MRHRCRVENRSARRNQGKGIGRMLVRVCRERRERFELADRPKPGPQRGGMPPVPAIDAGRDRALEEKRDRDEPEIRVVLVLIQHRHERLEAGDEPRRLDAAGDQRTVQRREPRRGKGDALHGPQQLPEERQILRW
jgi:hypothetical protein